MTIPKSGNKIQERTVDTLVNANLLKGKITASGYNQKSLALSVNMSVNSLNAKINGRKKFDTEEITKICDVLMITDAQEKCNIFLS